MRKKIHLTKRMLRVLTKLSYIRCTDKHISDSVPKSVDPYPLQETICRAADSTRISKYDNYIGSDIIPLTAQTTLTSAFPPKLILANLPYQLSP